jgi:hypothetical protein
MPLTSVSVTFEATDPADAEAKIATWTLHEGCNVSATMVATVEPSPGETDAGGKVQAMDVPGEPPPE